MPTTEEEREEHGEDGSGLTNLARRLVDAVRRRKVSRDYALTVVVCEGTRAVGTQATCLCALFELRRFTPYVFLPDVRCAGSFAVVASPRRACPLRRRWCSEPPSSAR